MKEIFQHTGIRYLTLTVLSMLVVFLAVQSIFTVKQMRFIGSGVTATNTIQVTGFGEIKKSPDVATFSVTVSELASDQTTAEQQATKKINDIIAYLQKNGIATKDMTTTSYTLNPQYDWNNSKRTLRGYRVSQMVTVKVRNIHDAGALVAQMSRFKAERVSGLSFTLENEDTVKAQARAKAIADAQQKAGVLAQQLGVRLVRIVSFSENAPQWAPPIIFARSEVATPSQPTPEIPTGENIFSSHVTITYEI